MIPAAFGAENKPIPAQQAAERHGGHQQAA
jgi:hypothetical protein